MIDTIIACKLIPLPVKDLKLLCPDVAVQGRYFLVAHLPLASGGAGITSTSRIAKIAYEASIAAYRGEDEHKQQARLTNNLNATVVKDLPAKLQQHLRWGRNAGWIMSIYSCRLLSVTFV